MNYAVTIYVDAAGDQVSASQTDQAGRRGAKGLARRTHRGNLVVSAGTWYPSQMAYRPFQHAVEAAAKAASLADLAARAAARAAQAEQAR